ncbi:hypothetical protein MSG28_011138 [Choristoneura fumiferana]|uniref:Uncharacterized protein n=1 Tax=Choristoneura fumiferana TaxID=7141 RepID=A0ACC0KR30_CHOFU|nr:hypothetical protein MSG28_011138 [Choristoneura fumiferana]
MSYYQNSLLVSSLYRSIVCERRDHKWLPVPAGRSVPALVLSGGGRRRARGVLRAPGMRLWRADRAAPYCTRSCSRYTPLAAGAPVAYCARPGMRAVAG